MLQLTQRTSAPSAFSVSISTAVCTVMCSEPMIFAPASGCLPAYRARRRHQAGHLVLGEADLVAAELGEARSFTLNGSRFAFFARSTRALRLLQ
jgi:hypothetical protein